FAGFRNIAVWIMELGGLRLALRTIVVRIGRSGGQGTAAPTGGFSVCGQRRTRLFIVRGQRWVCREGFRWFRRLCNLQLATCNLQLNRQLATCNLQLNRLKRVDWLNRTQPVGSSDIYWLDLQPMPLGVLY